MNPRRVFDAPARRRRARALSPRLGLAGVLVSVLAWPLTAPAQQQLPVVPGGPAPLKTLPTDALGQITPAWPSKKASPLQITPGMVPDHKQQVPVTPQPIHCTAFKGTTADMAALRQTAREAAGRRAIPATAFDPLIPKNCAGQEWAFYLRFLGSVGEGAL